MAPAKSASHNVIASEQQLADLIRQIEAADRIALDTEADSLHSYREKLCLLQISAPAAVTTSSYNDFVVDPLCNLRWNRCARRSNRWKLFCTQPTTICGCSGAA